MTEDWLESWDYGRTWYHGSPEELTSLKAGTTITQDRRLAEVFSHRPSWVSQEGDGPLKHNGTAPGWLYVVDEPIGPADVYPHPETAMAPGDEWLLRRELKVRRMASVEVADDERLSEEEIKALERRWRERASENE